MHPIQLHHSGGQEAALPSTNLSLQNDAEAVDATYSYVCDLSVHYSCDQPN